MHPAPPSDRRYRRRFLVEFTPAESDQLDRLGFAHGTKRKAILDGLQLLETGEVDALRTEVAALTAKLDAATTAAAKTAATQKADAKKQDAAAATAAAKLAKAEAAHQQTLGQLAKAQQDLNAVRRDLAAARAETQRLAALLPRHAYCGACDKLVPEAEWAEQPARDGVDVYHKPDGYRAKGGLLNGPATVLFWRPAPGAPKARS